MYLSEIKVNLYDFSCDYKIYAGKYWVPDTVLVAEQDDGGLPDQATIINAEYFMEDVSQKLFRRLASDFDL